MGFSFKKSIELGKGFRINLNKTGVNLTVSKAGSKKITLYHIKWKELFKKDIKAIKTKEIKSEVRDYAQSADYKELTLAIKKIKILDTIAVICGATVFLSFYPLFIMSGGFGLLLFVYLRIRAKVKLEYCMDESNAQKYAKRIEAWRDYLSSGHLWQITGIGEIKDKKIYAGAAVMADRMPLKVKKKLPFYIQTVCKPLYILLKRESFILLPDKILVLYNYSSAVLDYQELRTELKTIKFIEQKKLPKGGKVIEHTWKFVNKDGTPDKRYKGNKELPVCEYAQLEITTESGLFIILHSTDIEKAHKFNDYLKGEKDESN